MPTPPRAYSGIQEFVETCFECEPLEEETMSFIWTRWVHFAQTHPSVKPLWGKTAARHWTTLSKDIRALYPTITSAKRSTTYKRGDRDREGYSKQKVITVFHGFRFNRKATWEGFNGEWYPYPWINGPTSLGTPRQEMDPAYEQLQLRKQKSIEDHERVKEFFRSAGYSPRDPNYVALLKKCDNLTRDSDAHITTDVHITEEMINDVISGTFRSPVRMPWQVAAYRTIVTLFHHAARQRNQNVRPAPDYAAEYHLLQRIERYHQDNRLIPTAETLAAYFHDPDEQAVLDGVLTLNPNFKRELREWRTDQAAKITAVAQGQATVHGHSALPTNYNDSSLPVKYHRSSQPHDPTQHDQSSHDQIDDQDLAEIYPDL